jgi:hypothetical protein
MPILAKPGVLTKLESQPSAGTLELLGKQVAMYIVATF